MDSSRVVFRGQLQLESPKGLTRRDIENGFFIPVSGAWVGMAETAAGWPGISLSMQSLQGEPGLSHSTGVSAYLAILHGSWLLPE